MTWMGPNSPARLAMELRGCGWKVRTVAGRRIWYKGQAGSELVARNMDHAFNLETTLRRSKASGFMWGLDIAELLGSSPPQPPEPVTRMENPNQRPVKFHRIVVQLKAQHPVKKSQACAILADMLTELDLERRPSWVTGQAVYVESLVVKP